MFFLWFCGLPEIKEIKEIAQHFWNLIIKVKTLLVQMKVLIFYLWASVHLKQGIEKRQCLCSGSTSLDWICLLRKTKCAHRSKTGVDKQQQQQEKWSRRAGTSIIFTPAPRVLIEVEMRRTDGETPCRAPDK